MTSFCNKDKNKTRTFVKRNLAWPTFLPSLLIFAAKDFFSSGKTLIDLFYQKNVRLFIDEAERDLRIINSERIDLKKLFYYSPISNELRKTVLLIKAINFLLKRKFLNSEI